MIKDKDGKIIRTRTKSRGNVFQLNPTEMTCLVAMVDDNQIWNKIFSHINFDNIVKTSSMFASRDFLKIVKTTNTIFKECFWKNIP